MPEHATSADLRWDERGLITAVVQDAASGQVLMVAWMNQESLRLTLATGETHFWSRSRGELWHKGATSGNTQRVTGIRADCDGDTLLVQVEPAGPACHTGAMSCFFNAVSNRTLVHWRIGKSMHRVSFHFYHLPVNQSTNLLIYLYIPIPRRTRHV